MGGKRMKHLHKTICILLFVFIVLCSNCIIVSAESSEGVTVTITISTNDKNFKKGEEVVFKVNLTEQTGFDNIKIFSARLLFAPTQLKFKEVVGVSLKTIECMSTPDNDFNNYYAVSTWVTVPPIGTINKIVFEALQDHKDMGNVTVGLDNISISNAYVQADSTDEHVSEPSITISASDDSNTSPTPTSKLEIVLPACTHLFYDYDYTKSVSPNQVTLYGNGATAKVGDVNYSKTRTLYTDISPSYQYTLDKKGKMKPSIGKVIVGITTSNTKPTLTKGKIVDASAAKLAKATIKNGQITVTAVGKEQGTVYLWIMDTGSKGISECCPISIQLAPQKLEVQNTSGKKVASFSVAVGESAKVSIVGILSGTTKTIDPPYTYTVPLQ